MFHLFILVLSLPAAYGAGNCVLPAGAVLRVTLGPNSPRSAKPKAVFDGSLSQPFYNITCRVLPAGAGVKAVVDGTQIRAELTPPGHAPISVKTEFVRMATEKHAIASRKPERGARVLLLRVAEPVASPVGVESPLQSAGTVPAGTQVRVALEGGVTSRHSREGDSVRMRVLEPVSVDGKLIIPEGATVDGTLAMSKRARRMYRAGGLRFSFHSVQIPSGRAVGAPLTVAAGELGGGARIDAEGGITGSALTRKRALINAGIAYATGKILDDVIEEGAKAALGAAVAGSAETAARYIGLGAGVAVFLMHRGRDVALAPHTELVLTFSRALEISR